MSFSIARGLPFEVTVVRCHNLDNREWFLRSNPYVSVEYGREKKRTKICKDGGTDPTFDEKFPFTTVDGVTELNVAVWTKNALTSDDLICSGKIPFYTAFTKGSDDATWPLYKQSGRKAGEIKLILRFPHATDAKRKQKPWHKGRSGPSQPRYGNPHGSSSSTQASPPPYRSPSPSNYHTPPPYTAPYPSSPDHSPHPPSTTPPLASYPTHTLTQPGPPPPASYSTHTHAQPGPPPPPSYPTHTHPQPGPPPPLSYPTHTHPQPGPPPSPSYSSTSHPQQPPPPPYSSYPSTTHPPASPPPSSYHSNTYQPSAPPRQFSYHSTTYQPSAPPVPDTGRRPRGYQPRPHHPRHHAPHY